MWIRDKKEIPSGSREEIEIRASTIWCVDAIRREILRRHPETAVGGADAALIPEGSKTNEPEPAKDAESMSTASKDEKKTDDAEWKSTKVEVSTSAAESKAGAASEEMKKDDEEVKVGVNAILIDFLLYDTMKEMQAANMEEMPHHRTRSIWY